MRGQTLKVWGLPLTTALFIGSWRLILAASALHEDAHKDWKTRVKARERDPWPRMTLSDNVNSSGDEN